MNDGQTVAWRTLYAEAVDRLDPLDGAGDVGARRIVEAATGCDRNEFPRQLDELVSVAAKRRFDSMVRRRMEGEPLQYVVGSWAFRHLDLAVDRRVLIPRPETEIVAELAVAELRSREGPTRAVDLGTGSGAIALSLADECPATEVWATDVSAEALTVARGNLAGLGRAATRVTMTRGDWFEALDESWRDTIDVIVSNPPYVAEGDHLPAVVADWEPRGALVSGPSGLEAIEQVVEPAPMWLRDGGAIVVEIAPHQREAVLAFARSCGFADAEVHEDLSGRARVLVAR